MKNIILYEPKKDNPKDIIINPKIDGFYIGKYEEGMLKKNSKKTVDHILLNSYKVLSYLIDPSLNIKKTHKILCLGKVQSGKTSFFISSIALAFDNGYDLAYVIGGTKTSLKDQNYERLLENFSNNSNIKIIDINKKNHEDPISLLKLGFKVIIVALKNVSSDYANLGVINSYSEKLKDYPSFIVDDEGDECSPGAPKLKARTGVGGKTHDVLAEIINNVRLCTYLSVTATPQANFLLSTIDALSPDYVLLVEPGEGYTGGNAFHDIENNMHVSAVNDTDDFKTSTPDTFKSAFLYFIYDLLIENIRGCESEYSMLIHPSSLMKVHSMVYEKVSDYFSLIKKVLLDQSNVSFDATLNKIYEQRNLNDCTFKDYDDFKKAASPMLDNVLNQISIGVFNTNKDINIPQKLKYNVYIGGNMLGRGITINNLIVTYIYRDSKITNIDTLYQRARWFGYKQKYFYLCRVYMTKDLQRKFISTVESENDMWNAVESFLQTRSDVKKFPRVFTLNGDKLRLTRPSVSKTVEVERFNPGYNYDRSIWFNEKNEMKYNCNLYKSFLEEYKNKGQDIQFGKSEFQHHFVINIKFSEFYEKFISKYNFPKGSNIGKNVFVNIHGQIHRGLLEDQVYIIVMRYKTGEYRSPIANGLAIKELPQSYDSGTEYPGDKDLTGYSNKFHIQIHPVYINKDNNENIIPLLAMNNPISDYSIRFVTGDNFYG